MTITERALSRVSLAVRLLDDFSGRPSLVGATRVFIIGSGRTAVQKSGGYYVFMDLANTNVTIRIENPHYFPAEAAIDIAALDPRNPVVVRTMKPGDLYPFPTGTTLVRGVIRNPADHPVQGAHVSVTGAVVASESGDDGRFVLAWGPLDEDDISVVNHRRLVKVGNSTTINLGVTHPSFQPAAVSIGTVVEAELKILVSPIVMNP